MAQAIATLTPTNHNGHSAVQLADTLLAELEAAAQRLQSHSVHLAQPLPVPRCASLREQEAPRPARCRGAREQPADEEEVELPAELRRWAAGGQWLPASQLLSDGLRSWPLVWARGLNPAWRPGPGPHLEIPNGPQALRHNQSSHHPTTEWPRVARAAAAAASTLLSRRAERRRLAGQLADLAAAIGVRSAARLGRLARETTARARRVQRELLNAWRRAQRDARDGRKKAEKDAFDARRREEEQREVLRQQRKLNFLLTQTELYSHFLKKKLAGAAPAPGLAPAADAAPRLGVDALGDEALAAQAAARAQAAVQAEADRLAQFGDTPPQPPPTAGGAANDSSGALVSPPALFQGTLKSYQLRGVTWLLHLYDQGINGILADEMGLGKTVQTLTFLACLAEQRDIWGPFLILAPTSTLHNWQRECARFVPQFRVLPYWGPERHLLRKGWQKQRLQAAGRDSPFHVLLTNYNLAVNDKQYLAPYRWQYLVLDEAHAIKSSASARWRTLLSFQCRNRLLLTGTPIQNNMAELWALLHFIMPTLFDSHQEFGEWFARDIENQAENATQLQRLHALLLPFMLRRVKADVETELAPKVEDTLACSLAPQQQRMYQALRHKLSGWDGRAAGELSAEQEGHLMNIVMQLRKVCNHPELFELRRVSSPLALGRARAMAVRLPRLIFHEALDRLPAYETGCLGRRESLLLRGLSPFEISALHRSGWLSFLRLAEGGGYTAAEVRWLALEAPLLARALAALAQSRRPRSARCVLHMPLRDSLPTAQPFPQLLEVFLLAPLLAHVAPARATAASPQLLLPGVPALTRARLTDAHLATLALLSGRVETGPAQLYPLSSRPLRLPPELAGPASLGMEALLAADEPMWNVSGQAADGRLGAAELRLVGLGAPHLIRCPPPRALIDDAGKMRVLDSLLARLLPAGHRVLIYSQMTRMLDLLEEYLHFRRLRYVRLDGQSTLAERRDRVEAFQTNPAIPVFLLSTRAGGLGINLTAADTVVFYDSDWNPTTDAQAMDRAHRLGQTKQVTVYRLICRGTIEQRILQRAMHKHSIQYKVIDKFGQVQVAQLTAEQQREEQERSRQEQLMAATERNHNVVSSLLLADEEVEEMLVERLRRRAGGKAGRRAKSAALADGDEPAPGTTAPQTPRRKPAKKKRAADASGAEPAPKKSKQPKKKKADGADAAAPPAKKARAPAKPAAQTPTPAAGPAPAAVSPAPVALVAAPAPSAPLAAPSATSGVKIKIKKFPARGAPPPAAEAPPPQLQ